MWASNEQFFVLESLIVGVVKNTDILINGMQPVWVDAGDKIMLLIGEEE